MAKVYVGDVGTIITLDCMTDISSATERKMIVRKPDGSRVTWTAEPASANAMQYTVVSGDLDMPGDWEIQAYVNVPGWNGVGAVATFPVSRPL